MLGVILLIGPFRTISTAPVVPAQQNCAEGEPSIGDIQPDVNLTVLPSTTIAPLSNVSIVCCANRPRFPNSTAITSNLLPTNIIIYIGSYPVKDCQDTFKCSFALAAFFPTLPRTIICTANNINADCRFKVSDITLLEDSKQQPTSSVLPKTTYFPTIYTTLETGNVTINTTMNSEWNIKVWHVVVALLFGIFVGVIVSCLMMCFLRRFRKRKRQSKPEQPRENSAYENVDLNKMNKEESHQQSQANSAEEYENIPTYTDLSQTRDPENVYQSLT